MANAANIPDRVQDLSVRGTLFFVPTGEDGTPDFSKASELAKVLIPIKAILQFR